MGGIYFTSVCVLVRNVFRIFEYAQGNNGFIAKHEAILYVFDAALMFVVMVALLVVHPGRLIRSIRRSNERQSLVSEGSMVPISCEMTSRVDGDSNNTRDRQEFG